jgi:alpha-beta hydrolase superfamily lysophospholipase
MGNLTGSSTKQRMATYKWKAAAEAAPKGTLVLVHGFAEHLGRYNHVADFFAKQGFEVCGIDHMAHGLSEGFDGFNGYINFDNLVENWSDFVLAEVASKPGPHFVYCHSTGGTIVFAALDRGLADKWCNLKAVAFSAPLLRQPGAIAQPLYCCPTCARNCLTCGLACGTCCKLPGVKDGQLSTDPTFEKATRADPLYWGWKANLSVVRALLAGTVEVQKKLDRPSYPFLIMVSPKDTLVDPATAKLFYEKAPSTVKELRTDEFANAAHEIHNEPEEKWRIPLGIARDFFARPELSSC